ncbi:hypothetical protein L2E82_01497 [Cichorium intybus]|uniref:Uncharacterized protein n=1 Tax=Cichorium intybus TaxID=13427 RepID=A0ACB9GYR3_CICIN|nr:hypothetical protein L2E82_01497 [Cichorium intybus]
MCWWSIAEEREADDDFRGPRIPAEGEQQVQRDREIEKSRQPWLLPTSGGRRKAATSPKAAVEVARDQGGPLPVLFLTCNNLNHFDSELLIENLKDFGAGQRICGLARPGLKKIRELDVTYTKPRPAGFSCQPCPLPHSLPLLNSLSSLPKAEKISVK